MSIAAIEAKRANRGVSTITARTTAQESRIDSQEAQQQSLHRSLDSQDSRLRNSITDTDEKTDRNFLLQQQTLSRAIGTVAKDLATLRGEIPSDLRSDVTRLRHKVDQVESRVRVGDVPVPELVTLRNRMTHLERRAAQAASDEDVQTLMAMMVAYRRTQEALGYANSGNIHLTASDLELSAAALNAMGAGTYDVELTLMLAWMYNDGVDDIYVTHGWASMDPDDPGSTGVYAGAAPDADLTGYDWAAAIDAPAFSKGIALYTVSLPVGPTYTYADGDSLTYTMSLTDPSDGANKWLGFSVPSKDIAINIIA